jgi:hypothetical protein
MAVDQLVACRRKIERANEHITNLQAILQPFADANTYKVRREYDDKLGRLSFVLEAPHSFPVETSVLIGEALYHQRSTLDYLVWQLVHKNTGSPPTNTTKSGFPIFTTREGYKARGKAMIQGTSATAAARIESCQPFHRGTSFDQDPLWILQELNNTDKHRLLLVTCAYIGHGSGQFEFEPPVQILEGRCYSHINAGAVKHGTVLAWFETAQREVNMKGKIGISIALEKVGSRQYQSAVPLLTELSAYVSSILDAFETEFA